MTTTYQLARRLNEMRRIITAHSRPNWRSLALTHAETVSLIAKGAIKTMPDAEFEDLGEELNRRKRADARRQWKRKHASPVDTAPLSEGAVASSGE